MLKEQKLILLSCKINHTGLRIEKGRSKQYRRNSDQIDKVSACFKAERQCGHTIC